MSNKIQTLSLGRVYPIVNLEEGESLPKNFCTSLLSLNKVRILQLRAKHHATEELKKVANQLVLLRNKLGSEAKIIINDCIETALSSGADGVHIGQDDSNLVVTRQELGNQKIIGLSTHNLQQVNAAFSEETRPDYLAFGPVFETKTKKNPEPMTGLKALDQIKKVCDLPLVAIGGITAENSPSGVCVALISDLRNSEDLTARISMY